MASHTEKETILLHGRRFTAQELEDIEYMIRMFSHLSRNELAKTICEGLSWVSPNGRYKVESCQQLLEKLEIQGRIVLPEKRKTQKKSRDQHTISKKMTEQEDGIQGTVSQISPIQLEAVQGRELIRLWNSYVERYHMLGYKRPFGAHQRYFIWSTPLKRRLGCMMFSAAAWALSERDDWVGWTMEDRSQRLHLILNNTRFLIFPWVTVKNLASKALSLAVRQVPSDFQERYGYEPVLLETFVDIERHKGTCYRAANWTLLGQTKGRGRMDRHKQYLSSPKEIYMYPLVPDFRTHLCADTVQGGDNNE
jgi:hypothetical protein